MTRPRIGTVFLPGWAPELLRGVASAAEDSGLDDLWFWEDCFNLGGPTSAAIALAGTERITVGIGLMPAPLRQVAVLAMEIATLQRVFPGRFVPVVGHGVQAWMAQLGVKPASPLTLLTEYAVALKRLLAGEEVTVDGDYVHLDAVRLAAPAAEPHLLIGGEGPKTLALAATHGDGTMLTSPLAEDRIRDSIATVREVTAGRPHEIVGHLTARRDDAADEVAAAIERVTAHGMTTVLVHSTDEDPDPVGFVEWVGREVAPLVAR
ncbi:MAG TPA: LLM class flavin-dependent oxidoreductase [Pseudolysinimonas sp.]|nr:LLM class flavin-dependent oxidoreductase [Pseudolysinimonas sp.]